MDVTNSETQLSMIMAAFIAYIFSPIVFWFLLDYELASGAFPTDADSIGIPMAGFLVLLLSGLVIILIGAFSITVGQRILKKSKRDLLR
jgi:hypothetical protein